MEMIPCIKCKEDMPKLRKSKYGYNFCVNCSTVGQSKAITLQKGSGDNTWTETIIVDEDTFNSYQRQQEEEAKNKK